MILSGCFLGVGVADVEIITNVVRLEHGEHTIKILGLLQLGPAGAERRAGSRAETTDRLLRFSGEIDKILIQEAKHAIERAIDFLDGRMIEGFGDNASDARVDDGRRAARLADQTVSD